MYGLKDIKGYENILLLEEANLLQKTVINILKQIQSSSVIYVSLIKSYNSILSDLKKNNIKLDKFYLIDGVTKLVKKEVVEQKNILFSKPTDINGLGITVTEFMRMIPEEKWMILDALRVLTIYNSRNIVLRFIQFVMETAKKHDTKLVVLTTKSEDVDFVAKISKYFEKVISL